MASFANTWNLMKTIILVVSPMRTKVNRMSAVVYAHNADHMYTLIL